MSLQMNCPISICLILNFIHFINKIMTEILKPTVNLNKHHSIHKLQNPSLKCFDQSTKLKSITHSNDKIIISLSTRNICNNKQNQHSSPKYFINHQLESKITHKKIQKTQNMKLPQISKLKNQVSDNLRIKKHSLRMKTDCSKRFLTQHSACHYLTLDDQNQHPIDIHTALLQILNCDIRKSITLQSQIDKLSQLTKHSSDLRQRLVGIQQDMLTLNLKHKLSNIYKRRNQYSLR